MSNPIETIFTTTRELQEADRAGYLDDACVGDQKLRAQIEALVGGWGWVFNLGRWPHHA
ncbi:MAG: hypothetical protein JKY43_07790 [Phycisphaerales bacterium]|nr:hypothetical protein [Phycisphaerales bacterium]